MNQEAVLAELFDDAATSASLDVHHSHEEANLEVDEHLMEAVFKNAVDALKRSKDAQLDRQGRLELAMFMIHIQQEVAAAYPGNGAF